MSIWRIQIYITAAQIISIYGHRLCITISNLSFQLWVLLYFSTVKYGGRNWVLSLIQTLNTTFLFVNIRRTSFGDVKCIGVELLFDKFLKVYAHPTTETLKIVFQHHSSSRRITPIPVISCTLKVILELITCDAPGNDVLGMLEHNMYRCINPSFHILCLK